MSARLQADKQLKMKCYVDAASIAPMDIACNTASVQARRMCAILAMSQPTRVIGARNSWQVCM
jgi:hypothetical protein